MKIRVNRFLGKDFRDMSRTRLLYFIVIMGLTVFIIRNISSLSLQQHLKIVSSVHLLAASDHKYTTAHAPKEGLENHKNTKKTFKSHDDTIASKNIHEEKTHMKEQILISSKKDIQKDLDSTSSGSMEPVTQKVSVLNEIKNEQQPVINNTNRIDSPQLPPCPSRGSKLVGPLYIDQSVPNSITDVEKAMSVDYGGTVEKGGWWSPTTCAPRVKMALIIPYRNRFEQLKIFLRHMHPFLQRQQLFYRIIVVEQLADDPFNRAGLFNIGFAESLKISPFDCFVFSDVDLLPEDDRNYYGCPNSPRHMSVAVDKFNYQLPYETIFGGVGSFKKDDFEMINGMSNLFWGWGGEDDDLFQRITQEDMRLWRPSMQTGRYTMIKLHHFQSSKADPNRMNLLRNSKVRMKVDGLNTLKYDVKEIVEYPLVTFVKVEMKKRYYFQ